MPKIPTLDSGPRISMNPAQMPTQDIRQASVVQEAYGRLAAGVGDLAGDLLKKRAEAEATEFGDTSARDLRVEISKYESEAKMNAKGDHAGFSESLTDRLNTRRQELAEKAPNSKAKDYFMRRTEEWSMKTAIGAHNYEHTQRAQHYIRARTQRKTEMAGDFFDNPDPFKASAELGNFEADTLRQVGTQYNEDEAMKVINDARVQSRYAVFQGLLRDDLPGFNAGQSMEQRLEAVDTFLDGQMPGTEGLLSGISPQEKARFRKSAETALNRKAEGDESVAKLYIRNASMELSSGRAMSPERQGEINQAWNMAKGMKDGPEKELAIKTLVNAKAVGEFVESARDIPNSELRDRMANDFEGIIKDTGLMTIGVDRQAANMAQEEVTSMIRERNADGAAYVRKHKPAIANNVVESLKYQERLGIAEPRVLSKAEALVRSEAIMEGVTGQQRSLLFEQELRKYGDYAPQVVNEMTKENPKFPKGLQFALHFKDSVSRGLVMDNITQAKTISEEFAAKRPGKDLNANVTKYVAEMDAIYYRGNSPEMANSLREVVTTEAQRRMLSNEKLSADDAAKQASEMIIGRNFQVYNNKHTFLIPNHILETNKMTKKTVEAYVSGSLSPSGLKDLGVTPERIGFDGSPEEFQQVIEKYSRWVPSTGQDGIRLYYDGPGKQGFLNNAKGNRVEVKFADMKYNQRSLDNQNSLLPNSVREYLAKVPIGKSLGIGQ